MLTFLVFIIPALGYTNTTCTSTYIDHTFDYSDAYTNHGWDSHSTCTYSGTRQNYPFDWNISGTIHNESFGINATIDCGTGISFSHRLNKDPLIAVTSGNYLISFNFALHNRTGGQSATAAFQLTVCKSGTNDCFAILLGIGSENNSRVTDLGGSSWNVETCTATSTWTQGVEHTALLDMDLDANLYTLYIDKVEVGCSAKSLGVLDSIGKILVLESFLDGETSYREFDDLVMCSGYLDSVAVDTAIVVDDLESGIRRFYQDAGLQDEESQYIAGILILLFVVGGMLYTYYVHSGGQGMGGFMGAAALGFMLSILLTVIGLLPLWIPVLWFIVGGVGVFFAARASVSGGG